MLDKKIEFLLCITFTQYVAHRVHSVHAHPLYVFTITSKVAVYTPAEWADTLTLFHL